MCACLVTSLCDREDVSDATKGFNKVERMILRNNIFSINNTLISNSQVIAEEFNNFVVSIGPQLASNISSSTNHMFYTNTVANISDKCYFTL